MMKIDKMQNIAILLSFIVSISVCMILPQAVFATTQVKCITPDKKIVLPPDKYYSSNWIYLEKNPQKIECGLLDDKGQWIYPYGNYRFSESTSKGSRFMLTPTGFEPNNIDEIPYQFNLPFRVDLISPEGKNLTKSLKKFSLTAEFGFISDDYYQIPDIKYLEEKGTIPALFITTAGKRIGLINAAGKIVLAPSLTELETFSSRHQSDHQ